MRHYRQLAQVSTRARERLVPGSLSEALMGVFEVKELYDERYAQLLNDSGIATAK